MRTPNLARFADTAAVFERSPIEVEIVAEQAAALGRAGEVAESRVADLNAANEKSPERPRLLREAADAVYAYFIQRELCGYRRHDDVIRELRIPRAVLVRLGVR